MSENPVLKVRKYRVIELVWETASVYTLKLEPSDPRDAFPFAAGQWVYLHLSNPDGTPWARAAYSIASAPEEPAGHLQLGIKISGDFTKAASKLMPDDVVGIQGPFGVFVLPPGNEPLVMFAAGIGITPFRSMIRSVEAQNTKRNIVLFYSNKTVEDAAYFEEFEALRKTADWFKPVFILTQDAPDVWPGEKGRLNGEMLDRHLLSLQGLTFLMCGPPSFMDAVKEMLVSRGVELKRIRREKFG